MNNYKRRKKRFRNRKAYWQVVISALALCLLIMLAMLPKVFKKDEPVDPGVTDVVILSTTDMHGKCWEMNVLTDSAEKHNMLRVLTAVEQYRKEYGSENTLLIDNGDLFQGTQVSEVQLRQYRMGESSDSPAMAVCLKKIGYDAFVLGNHEFDFDWDTMHTAYSWLEENGIPVLAANTVYDGTDGIHEAGENAFTPYIIKTITVNGHPHKIGILGLENTDITRMVLPDKYPGIRFAHPGNDNYSISYEANLFLPQMREEGCEFIIVSYHGGLGRVNGDVTFGINSGSQGLRLARETEDIDLLILGHDHSSTYSNTFVRDGGGKNLLVVNGGGQDLTRTVFRFFENSDGGLVWELTESDNLNLGNFDPDEELEALIAPYAKTAESAVNIPIGTAAGDWDESADYYCHQTDSIDLVNAAMINVGNKRLAELNGEVPEGAEDGQERVVVRDGVYLDHLDVDMSITNVSTNNNYVVHSGDISSKDVYRLYRYANNMLVLPMYGHEIRAVMEENAADRFTARVLDAQFYIYPTYLSTNLVFGGLDFTYDFSRPEGQRVQIRGFSSGRAFDEDGLYLVAVNSFLLGNKQCGLRDFGEEDAVWSQLDKEDGESIQNIIMEYIQDQCEAEGAITPAAFTWNWDIQYTADPDDLPPYEGKIAANYAQMPEDGHRYVLLYEPETRVITRFGDSSSLDSEYCEVYGEALTAPLSDSALVVAAQDAGDGTMLFIDPDGRYLSGDKRGNLTLSKEKKDSGLSQWVLEPVSGGVNIVNAAIGDDRDKKLAIEYYNGRFMTFQLSDSMLFIFNFYEIVDN